MFKFKTVKLLAVTILSASSVYAFAEDFPVSDMPVTDGSMGAGTEQQIDHWVDFSDPTAINSKVGLATGSEGVDVHASLGGYLGGQFEQRLTVEAMHDVEYYNINYFAFNTSTNTGFTLNSTWGNDPDYDEDDEFDYNEVSVGVIKKVGFQENPSLTIYPSMRFGLMWDWDNSMSNTTFVELDTAIRIKVTPDFWFGVTPNYRYALNGLHIKDLDATADVGYQLAQEVAVAAHYNSDEEIWADFSFAF